MPWTEAPPNPSWSARVEETCADVCAWPPRRRRRP